MMKLVSRSLLLFALCSCSIANSKPTPSDLAWFASELIFGDNAAIPVQPLPDTIDAHVQMDGICAHTKALRNSLNLKAALDYSVPSRCSFDRALSDQSLAHGRDSLGRMHGAVYIDFYSKASELKGASDLPGYLRIREGYFGKTPTCRLSVKSFDAAGSIAVHIGMLSSRANIYSPNNRSQQECYVRAFLRGFGLRGASTLPYELFLTQDIPPGDGRNCRGSTIHCPNGIRFYLPLSVAFNEIRALKGLSTDIRRSDFESDLRRRLAINDQESFEQDRLHEAALPR